MHVAFALMIAIPAIFLVKHRALKILWGIYPLVVTFVVMVTANHFWLDAALGALVAAASAYAATPRSRGSGPMPGAGDRRGQGTRVSDEIRERPARPRARSGREGARSAGEMRELARDRLIESRLTPNAISVTGLIGNLIAAVLILEHHFVLAGVAFILGSLCDMFDGRYSRMSGKGTPFGAFLDSTLDRVEEGIARGRRGLVRAGRNDVAVGATVVAVVGAYMVSYTRARRRRSAGRQGRNSFARRA